jgi:hypothetical protein
MGCALGITVRLRTMEEKEGMDVLRRRFAPVDVAVLGLSLLARPGAGWLDPLCDEGR